MLTPYLGGLGIGGAGSLSWRSGVEWLCLASVILSFVW